MAESPICISFENVLRLVQLKMSNQLSMRKRTSVFQLKMFLKNVHQLSSQKYASIFQLNKFISWPTDINCPEPGSGPWSLSQTMLPSVSRCPWWHSLRNQWRHPVKVQLLITDRSSSWLIIADNLLQTVYNNIS